jgi:hypothetical protein
VLLFVISLTLFLVYAPVVPFERLQEVYYPITPGGCGTQGNQSSFCGYAPHGEWLRSYGSFSYDALGFGTAPYAAPVTFSKNGFTNILTFNGTDVEEQIVYPEGVPPPPLDLITVDDVLVFRGAAPFGGTTIAVNATNHGTNETAEVGFILVGSNGNGFFPNPEGSVGAGRSAVINSTTWVGPFPAAGSTVKVEVSGSVCYGRICAPYLHVMVVPVVQVSPGTKANA